MPPMACGATGTGECTGSFSSVSSTVEGLGEEFRLPYHGKPPFLAGSPPEIGEDDGDLRLVIAGTSDSLSTPPAATKKKKKRSLPGTPDPSAEVIALSPRTLMATNRFVCEICHKGFQRDQNLQLHRRGHNLPWKLRQRGAEGGAAPRKRAAFGAYDGVVGFGVGGLMPGQLYNDGANGGTTRNAGPAVSGADNPMDDERRRAAAGDDVRVVDYMGVEHQRTSYGSVSSASPFADYTGPWP
ncbi:unnamed protein product [Triticum turgidum subsp. durum]|uniref:C2H2-type domain-containing protein n=1 Tax=Triticum turgidum subsp. durum TaxID=4567 RepID=A0A9R1QVH7_TRITD|nr:unnamed protein product [Triticum turgidum subsp. durum]